ncbi:MAG: tRNA (adenosine(37)-N6)-dimethylallyltransferase MiaA [Patescibacteria group bacterium]
MRIIGVIGPTASGKSAKAVALAKELDGEVISVDSRQVYRTLDIGTEKTITKEMGGIPHYLIDVREPEDAYSAGDFVHDAKELIKDIQARGKVPILAGGTHFYFDALLYALPPSSVDPVLRHELEKLSAEELFTRLQAVDPRRASRIDAHNPRRLIRALEIVAEHGSVPERVRSVPAYDIEWITIDPPKEELRARIDARLEQALARGLIDEVRAVRERVGDIRLNELGLEYRIVGEYLRGERSEASLLPSLSTKLWHYARHQKAWLRKLQQ